MHVLTLIDNPKLPDTLNGFTAAVAAFGCKCIHALFRLFHVTPKKTYGKYLKYATNCPEPDSDLYIDYSYITGQNLMIRTKEAFPTIEVPFEDTTVALVRNYDSFLRPNTAIICNATQKTGAIIIWLLLLILEKINEHRIHNQ